MNKYCLIIILVLSTIGCSKSSDQDAPVDLMTDPHLLLNKEWYWGGKQEPQLVSFHFRPDDTLVLRQHVNSNDPNGYATLYHWWKVFAKDSIILDDYYKVKVFSLNDSVLITSNWMIGGIGYSLPDTLKNVFTTY